MIKHSADNLLVTGKNQVIACPVLGIEMSHANMHKIMNQILTLLVGGSGCRDFAKSSYRPNEKKQPYKYKNTTTGIDLYTLKSLHRPKLDGHIPQREDERWCSD